MAHDHQKIYHRAWSQLGPPLRPPADVAVAIREQIKDRHGRTLLLGVTPELADVAPNLVAIDRNMSMVAHVWPGNTAHRRAIVGDWRKTNFVTGAFSTCIGDGSLSFLTFPDEMVRLFDELIRILEKGGRAVFRLYLSPDVPEMTSTLRDQALSGQIKNFHAFKIRLAMSLAAQGPVPQVCVANILDIFNSQFANRDELASVTGWSREQIDTIDFYRESSVIFSLPTQDQLLSISCTKFPGVRLVPSGTYELSERCPLLVVDLR
jgi:SAM-dependent methyltransferase